MENNTNTDRIYFIVFLLLMIIIGFFVVKTSKENRIINSQEVYIEKLEKELEYYHTLDSTYVLKRDSIVYNIMVRDTIIYKIKEKYGKQKDSVLHSSDNVVVNKFNELVWTD